MRFETFGGTAIGSRKAKRGEKLTRPPVPEKEGCGFGGCMGCSCQTKNGAKRICKEGPVLKKEEIIW